MSTDTLKLLASMPSTVEITVVTASTTVCSVVPRGIAKFKVAVVEYVIVGVVVVVMVVVAVPSTIVGSIVTLSTCTPGRPSAIAACKSLRLRA
jgi:hypothetical protein